MKTLFIINPKSGKGRGVQTCGRIERFCRRNELPFEIWLWDPAKESVESLGKRARASDADAVFVAGGDGTINSVGSQFIGSDVKFGVLPLGTGNAIAHHLGIPKSIDRALQMLIEHEVVKVDTGLMNGTPFIGFCGFGLDAEVAHAYSALPKRSFFTYAYYTLKCYLDGEPHKLVVKYGDRQTVSSSHVVTVANVSQLGHRAKLAPGASLRDGQLDLCTLQIPSVWHVPMIVWRMFQGTLPGSRYYRKIQQPHFTFTRTSGGVAQIDGETFQTDKTVDVRVLPESLNMILPANARAVI